MQGVSKRALEWYSKCCCVVGVTKTFTLKGVQTLHRSKCEWWIVPDDGKLLLMLEIVHSRLGTVSSRKLTKAYSGHAHGVAVTGNLESSKVSQNKWILAAIHFRSPFISLSRYGVEISGPWIVHGCTRARVAARDLRYGPESHGQRCARIWRVAAWLLASTAAWCNIPPHMLHCVGTIGFEPQNESTAAEPRIRAMETFGTSPFQNYPLGSHEIHTAKPLPCWLQTIHFWRTNVLGPISTLLCKMTELAVAARSEAWKVFAS
jgi:hypothetical protein